MNRIAQENLPARFRVLPVALMLACSLSGATATANEPAAETASVQTQISAAIDGYLSELKGNRYTRMNADVQPLDARLKLASCAQPLEVEHQPRERIGGRITLRVSCPDVAGWSVRIPANLQVFDYVVVAGTSIPMGTHLTGKELTVQEMDVALLYRGYYNEISQVQGFIAKRPIPGGQVLSPVTVNPAHLVSKGETVSILAEGPGITIRALGVALMDGAMGQVIQVKNTKSNKVVEGRISAPGQIKVAL